MKEKYINTLSPKEQREYALLNLQLARREWTAEELRDIDKKLNSIRNDTRERISLLNK